MAMVSSMPLRDCAYCLYKSRDNQKEPEHPIDCFSHSPGRPCVGCERWRALRTRIEETKTLLDKLIIEELNFRMDLNRCHDITQRLPPEITSHIFSFTLSDMAVHEVQSKSRHDSVERYKPTPLILGAVCRNWREIAWSTPRLWSTIMLTLRHKPTEEQIDVMREWLQRSQQLPLKIQLFFQTNAGVYRKPFHRFVKVLNEHSTRWETLSVHSPGPIANLFVGDKQGAPHLKTLQLILPKWDRPGKFALKGAPPEPTSIDVSGYLVKDIAISWNNLTHATITFNKFSSDCYIALFQEGIKLVKLQLHCRSSSDPTTPANLASPTIQSQLRDLGISVGRGRFSPLIFDTVTLPLLERLSILGRTTMALGSVKRFLARSSPPLRSFNLRAHCDQQDVLDLLYNMPLSLKVIQLDLEDMSDDLYNLCDHLSRVPDVTVFGTPPHRELLPNLEVFRYHWTALFPCPMPFGRLPNLLRPLSGQRRPLKKLAFYPRCDGPQDDPLLSTDNIQESAIRGLVGLLDDGVDLYLPDKVSREDLLAMLEKY